MNNDLTEEAIEYINEKITQANNFRFIVLDNKEEALKLISECEYCIYIIEGLSLSHLDQDDKSYLLEVMGKIKQDIKMASEICGNSNKKKLPISVGYLYNTLDKLNRIRLEVSKTDSEFSLFARLI